MENFIKLSAAIADYGISRPHAFEAIKEELAEANDLWNKDNFRKRLVERNPHREADDLLLRFNEIPEDAADWDELECVAYGGWKRLFETRELVRGLGRRLGATRLGRVMVTRLKPGGQIYPHQDAPEQTSYYNRFHYVVQGNSTFAAGEETITMEENEVWCFDNSKEHSVVNSGYVDRIHLIMDFKRDNHIFKATKIV